MFCGDQGRSNHIYWSFPTPVNEAIFCNAGSMFAMLDVGIIPYVNRLFVSGLPWRSPSGRHSAHKDIM